MAALGLLTPIPSAAVDVLPDLVTNPVRLNDNEYVTDIVPGRLHLRLSNGVQNPGSGEFRIVAGETSGESQTIFQSIERVDLSDPMNPVQLPSRLIEAGNFRFHAAHSHFHVDNWAQFRIREVLPGDLVGQILFNGVKTSFCLLDVSRIPGIFTTRRFFGCGSSEQGISSGWEDVYFKELPDQWIDITGITPGEYWIESIADPFDIFLESDETNNVALVKLIIVAGDLPVPDEIPLDPRLPWAVSVVLVLTGMGALHRIYKRNGGSF